MLTRLWGAPMGVTETLIAGVGFGLILLGRHLWPVADDNLFEFPDIEP